MSPFLLCRGVAVPWRCPGGCRGCAVPTQLSTKSGFLCAFWLWDPHFLAFRAQNRGFCVRMGDFSEIFGRFDTKREFLCSGSITMVVPANHRAHQCALEVHRTRIRVRGELQERRTRPCVSLILHPTPASSAKRQQPPAPNTCAPGQATASSGGDTEVA